MGFEHLQKQLLEVAWEKGYLNTTDHYDLLSKFTKLSRKQISDYRRKRSIKHGGFPAPKPKEQHKPKKFDDMCRTFLKSAWNLGYLPGRKHYGMLADFSGLSRKQISDWSRKYSIKLGLKSRSQTNNKRRMKPLFQIKNLAKRRRFDEKPKIPIMEVKSEDEFELTSGGFVDCLPDPHFSLKPAFDDDFRLKNDFLPSHTSISTADLGMSNSLSYGFPFSNTFTDANISPPASPLGEWDFDLKIEAPRFFGSSDRMPRASEDDLWTPADY